MANSTTHIDTISQSQAAKEITANAFFDAASASTQYGRRQSTTSGLSWGFYGGNITLSNGSMTQVANGIVTLTANTTNYVVADKTTGAVSVSTVNTNWNNQTAYWRLYSIVAGASTVTSYIDAREMARYTGAEAAIFNASAIVNTPAGNIAAINVQTAINELDTEKAKLAGDTFTGPVICNVNSASAAFKVTQSGSGDSFVVEDVASDTTPFCVNTTGQVVVGNATAIPMAFSDAANFQVVGAVSRNSFGAFSSDTFAPVFEFNKSKSATIGTHALIALNDYLGTIRFAGSDGSAYRLAASIDAYVDAAPGASDMPGRLVFSTTSDASGTPAERFRITNAGSIMMFQATPVAINATATLTATNLITQLLTSTTAAAVVATLPTGTLMDAAFNTLGTNMSIDFTVINTGPNTFTVAAGSTFTVTGNMVVAAGASATFRCLKTAANTFVCYRL